MKNADMPAMPIFDKDAYPLDFGGEFKTVGLTKREMMAMHILSSMHASPSEWVGAGITGAKMAKYSVDMTDSLLMVMENNK